MLVRFTSVAPGRSSSASGTCAACCGGAGVGDAEGLGATVAEAITDGGGVALATVVGAAVCTAAGAGGFFLPPVTANMTAVATITARSTIGMANSQSGLRRRAGAIV